MIDSTTNLAELLSKSDMTCQLLTELVRFNRHQSQRESDLPAVGTKSAIPSEGDEGTELNPRVVANFGKGF